MTGSQSQIRRLRYCRVYSWLRRPCANNDVFVEPHPFLAEMMVAIWSLCPSRHIHSGFKALPRSLQKGLSRTRGPKKLRCSEFASGTSVNIRAGFRAPELEHRPEQNVGFCDLKSNFIRPRGTAHFLMPDSQSDDCAENSCRMSALKDSPPAAAIWKKDTANI